MNLENSFISHVMRWAAHVEEIVPEVGFLCFAQGVFDGGPDFILPVSVEKYAGLMIFVAEGAELADEHKSWADSSKDLRFGTVDHYCKVRVWGGPNEAIGAIRKYLEPVFRDKVH